MADVLERILAAKADEIAHARERRPEADLRAAVAGGMDRPRDFAGALRACIARDAPAVIAEIKKASPSRGLMREDFDAAAIAREYRDHGAACISVLTDEKFFQGCSAHLVAARAASGLPVLRKDFILDAYQVWESRAMGADCILLIAAALDDARLSEFQALATELGMSALIEVHDAAEMERVARTGAFLIGINNRNLRTFETSLDVTLQLKSRLPAGALLVTESGIHAPENIALMRSHGVNAFLVGEALMRAPHPGEALSALLSGVRPGTDA